MYKVIGSFRKRKVVKFNQDFSQVNHILQYLPVFYNRMVVIASKEIREDM